MTEISDESFVTVAKVGAIAEGTGTPFAVGGRMVAVFFVEGEYFAIDDFCPHMGASLAGGHVQDKAVACPWHAWRFCLNEGTWLDNPKLKVDRFDVRVEGDDIQVRVPKPEQAAPAASNETKTCPGATSTEKDCDSAKGNDCTRSNSASGNSTQED